LPLPIYYLRVEIEILSGHETWEHCVQRICKPPAMVTPEEFFRVAKRGTPNPEHG